MLLIVDRHNGIPAYRQIMDQVKFQIAAGRLKPGAALPSTRSLAEQLAINPMTISKAYSLLEHEGVVERRPGMPLVVSDTGEHARQQARHAQLRQCLAPIVTQVLQLEADTDEAVRIFKALLTEQMDSQENQTS